MTLTTGVNAMLALFTVALCGLASVSCTHDSAGEITLPPPAGPPAATGPVGPIVVGKSYLEPRSYIEYIAGDAPLVIIAPHGGAMLPTELPDRACSVCVITNDSNTQDLAVAVVDSFYARTGARPHLVLNRLHRRKFDGNRERAEATGGNSALDATWAWMQAAIDTATHRVSTASRSSEVGNLAGRGLVIDLHGHGHSINRLELGYLLSAQTLRLSDASLDASSELSHSSIARLVSDAKSGQRGVALLRGANSLGALLSAAGYASIPSPSVPAPQVGEEYFDGGFNTQRNGSSSGGLLDAIQIESQFTGVRDSAINRARFAGALSAALMEILERQYGWKP